MPSKMSSKTEGVLAVDRMERAHCSLPNLLTTTKNSRKHKKSITASRSGNETQSEERPDRASFQVCSCLPADLWLRVDATHGRQQELQEAGYFSGQRDPASQACGLIPRFCCQLGLILTFSFGSHPQGGANHKRCARVDWKCTPMLLLKETYISLATVIRKGKLVVQGGWGNPCCSLVLG